MPAWRVRSWRRVTPWGTTRTRTCPSRCCQRGPRGASWPVLGGDRRCVRGQAALHAAAVRHATAGTEADRACRGPGLAGDVVAPRAGLAAAGPCQGGAALQAVRGGDVVLLHDGGPEAAADRSHTPRRSPNTCHAGSTGYRRDHRSVVPLSRALRVTLLKTSHTMFVQPCQHPPWRRHLTPGDRAKAGVKQFRRDYGISSAYRARHVQGHRVHPARRRHGTRRTHGVLRHGRPRPRRDRIRDSVDPVGSPT